MSSGQKRIILLASDLMLNSTISGLAAAVACPFRSAGTVAEAINLLNESRGNLFLVDLGLPGLDVTELAAGVSEDTLQNAVAYGPHVHIQKLEAAKQAGFGRVMSRGGFSAAVGQLIADYGAKMQE